MGLMDKVKVKGAPEGATFSASQLPKPPPEEHEENLPTAPAYPRKGDAGEALLKMITQGDLKGLSTQDKIAHYVKVCTDVGLNPMTKPFDYVTIGGKTFLAANKECGAQLSKLHTVSIEVKSVAMVPDQNIYECWVRASTPDGRVTDELGAVPLSISVKGADAANARMKCVTKAKRRAVLAHCGLGMLDESEIETISGATVASAETIHVEDTRVARPPVTEVRPPDTATPPSAADRGQVVEAELAADSDGFEWNNKEDRQWLIKTIQAQRPGINKENMVQIASVYKSEKSRSAIVEHIKGMA